MTPTIHNPENVPPSAVPAGWRFMWQHEVGKLPEGTPCRLWGNNIETFYRQKHSSGEFKEWTYIVPADFTLPGESAYVAPAAPPAQRKILHMCENQHGEITVLCDDGTWWRVSKLRDNASWLSLNIPPLPQP